MARSACFESPKLPAWTLVNHRPVPSLTRSCGSGHGLAACPKLGIFAATMCTENTVHIYGLPMYSDDGMMLLRTLGKDGSVAFTFSEEDDGFCGDLAFTTCSNDVGKHLFVASPGKWHSSVIVFRTFDWSVVGSFGGSGSAKVRGVASCGSFVAVCFGNYSSFASYRAGGSRVILFQENAERWTRIREIDSYSRWGIKIYWHCPLGVRFTSDTRKLMVADESDVVVLDVDTGACLDRIGFNRGPSALEVFDGGFLAICSLYKGNGSDIDTIDVVDNARRYAGGPVLSEDGDNARMESMALVPGLGLIIRDKPARYRYTSDGIRLRVISDSADVSAMVAMSKLRVAWIRTVVCCGLVRSALLLCK